MCYVYGVFFDLCKGVGIGDDEYLFCIQYKVRCVFWNWMYIEFFSKYVLVWMFV